MKFLNVYFLITDFEILNKNDIFSEFLEHVEIVASKYILQFLT